MSNLCLAQLRMQDQLVHISRNPESGCIVCFKTRGAVCEYEVFDGDDESEIIEYIIQPVDMIRWQVTFQ
jgi:hypothetical protein